MAKAQAAKPKSGGLGEWFRKITAPKPKVAPARPAASSSTLTNIPAATTSGAGTRTGTKVPAPKKVVQPGGEGIARFRLPVLGTRPVTDQMRILGILAFLLLALSGFMVF